MTGVCKEKLEGVKIEEKPGNKGKTQLSKRLGFKKNLKLGKISRKKKILKHRTSPLILFYLMLCYEIHTDFHPSFWQAINATLGCRSVA